MILSVKRLGERCGLTVEEMNILLKNIFLRYAKNTCFTDFSDFIYGICNPENELS